MLCRLRLKLRQARHLVLTFPRKTIKASVNPHEAKHIVWYTPVRTTKRQRSFNTLLRTLSNMDAAKAAFEAFKPIFGKAIEGLQNLKWEQIPEPVRDYIEAHPALTTIQLLSLILFACPWLTVTPLFYSLGFSGLGPMAGKRSLETYLQHHGPANVPSGSWAAVFQSAYGAVPAFSCMQSVPMAGYGAAAANGIVQGGYAVGIGVAEYFKWCQSNGSSTPLARL